MNPINQMNKINKINKITKIAKALFKPLLKTSQTRLDLYKQGAQVGLNELLGYMMHFEPGTILMKDGAFLAVFAYRGPDVESSTDGELDQIVSTLNHALKMLDRGWMVEFNLVRLPSNEYRPGSNFPDAVSALIEAERQAQYQTEGSHFDTLTYLTLTYLPDRELKTAVKKFFMESDQPIKDVTIKDLSKRFEEKLSSAMDVLTKYLRIERLKDKTLLTFLHYCITGQRQSVQVPPVGLFLDSYLSHSNFVGGIRPRIGNKNIRVINVSEYPAEVYPTMLELLNSLPIVYRWSLRFIPLSQNAADDKLKEISRGWYQKALGFKGMARQAFGGQATLENGDAADMVEQVERAKNLNSSGVVRFGYVTNVIVLMNENANKLEEEVRMVTRGLQQLGFLTKDEDYNSIDAFLGSIPGHGERNIRKVLLNSYELSCMAPISAIYQGEEFCPCPFYPASSPALFYSATQGSTPFRFNLHVGDLGHTTIIGPTGAGKSTLLGLLIAQHRKYPNSHVYVFDKDNSNKVITLALGGDYYDVGKNQSISLAPLSHIDDPEEFDWTLGFVENLLELQGLAVTPEHKAEIRDGLNNLKESNSNTWNIEGLIDLIQNSEIRSVLRVYTESEAMASLINATHDHINMSSLMAFEMGWLLEQKEAFYLPVIDYLFRVLYRQFKKRHPALLILDEGWLYLDNHYFASKLKDWFKTLRKFNVAIVIATQSLQDAAKSQISSVLLESCKTKIYLPNDAMTDESKAMYKFCGLNDRQISIIGGAKPKRDYYVMYPRDNRLITLGLGRLTLAFIGVSSKEDIEAFLSIYSKNDPNWVAKWLEYKALPEWVNHFKQNYAPTPHVPLHNLEVSHAA